MQAQNERVRDTICEICGGVPEADWLPFWVYDEYSECTCLSCEHEFVPYCSACGKPCMYETSCRSCGDLGSGVPRQCHICGTDDTPTS